MNPLYLAAGASFLAGMCGYIIVRFWLIPIRRYKKARRILHGQLKELGCNPGQGSKEQLTMARRKAMRLVDIQRYELPYWYRLVLIRRQEFPEKALDAIVKFEKSKAEQLEDNLRQALSFLKLRI